MKLLTVLGSDDGWDQIIHALKPMGFEIIRYRHVLKAMDNLDEVDPSAVIISAQDFPRHWKPLIQFIRNERPRETCPIIILRGPLFSDAEASHALYLGANGVVKTAAPGAAEEKQLRGLLNRYLPAREKRKNLRYSADREQGVNFLIAHPRDGVILTGRVKNISRGGLFFSPDHLALVGDIPLNATLSACSLRVGRAIFSPVCKLSRAGTTLALEFLSFPEKEQARFEASLEGLPPAAPKSRNRPLKTSQAV
ncbi:MAG: PilZ domain-containing protein [Treponema sp.]|jgi:hypothetical protein|nr:PilZ domain-containing protein [Treponema sp.]